MVALTLKRLLGVLCLLVGLFALVTPLTPGSWLALVGIELLGLTFLLPRPIRTRWEALKMKLIQRWHDWLRTRRQSKDADATAKTTTPHAGGRGL